MYKKNLLFFFGRPFSPIYKAIMQIRSFLYKKNVFKRYNLPVPVISVGNLTMGGTGKTPIVCYIASFLQKSGYKPAIISRGYGGVSGEKVNIVSDGKTVFLNSVKAGDEPVMMANKLPGVPVLTGIVRALPCKYAIKKFLCDIIILDDGFQHMAVNRDINLVLFDSSTLAGNSRIFPGGDLREPVNALNRADAFIMTSLNKDNETRALKFKELLNNKFTTTPVFTTNYVPENDKINSSIASPSYAFCGIANPQRFINTMTAENIKITGYKTFNDHQPYTQKILDQITTEAIKSGAESLITTEKDMVKIANLKCKLPINTLVMTVKDENGLEQFILKKLAPLSNY